MKSVFLKYLLIITIVPIAFSSCKKDGWPCRKGSGPIQTELRNVTDFAAVDNQTEANIYITQGSEYEVKVVAQQNMLEEIRTEISGNELQIYSEHCLGKHDPINVYITTPTLYGLRISGSGYAETTNKISTSSLDLVVSGSGLLQVKDSIFATNVNITVSGSGKIDFIGQAVSAEAVISGSGNITMFGQGTSYDTTEGSSLNLTISGSGYLSAFNYPVNTCHFTMSGSGNAEVNVNKLLEGTLSGSGSLFYKGNPPIVNVQISGSGVIMHVD
jgi:hypothetical protein